LQNGTRSLAKNFLACNNAKNTRKNAFSYWNLEVVDIVEVTDSSSVSPIATLFVSPRVLPVETLFAQPVNVTVRLT
jgi:hypothetical protein